MKYQGALQFTRDGFILASAQKELTWYWCLLDFSILKCYKLRIWVCWLLIFMFKYIYQILMKSFNRTQLEYHCLKTWVDLLIYLFACEIWLLCASTSPSLCLLTALGHSFCLFHKLLSCTWLKVTFSSCNLPISHALNYNYQYICWQFPSIYLQLIFFS